MRGAPVPTEWVIVVPVKGTSAAKSRLALADRGELAEAFAIDTVAAASSARGVLLVVAVSGSDSLDDELRRAGAHVLREATPSGLNAAIAQGILYAREAHPGAGVAVLLGDLPALAGSELAASLRLAAHVPRGFVPDAAGIGTVLVTAAPGATHDVQFGGASRAAHLKRGYVELDVPVDSGLRRDVDTADDLVAVAGRSLGPATAALLQRR
jgi:2-phospho-L-lactate guanylyltransferase